jgi:hypothetical protein
MISEVFMTGMRGNPVNDKNSSGGSCFISNSGLPFEKIKKNYVSVRAVIASITRVAAPTTKEKP